MTVQEAIDALSSMELSRPVVVELADGTWEDVTSIQMQYDADMPDDGGAVVIHLETETETLRDA